MVNTELDKSNIIDPQYKDLQVGDVVSSIEAVTDSVPLDTRPKVFDNLSKQWVLLDTGSCVSCIPPTKEDLLNPHLKLRSVNGGVIDTFGKKTMHLRMGRKTYSIEAVIAAVPSPIFGWDLFKKYSLGFQWNQWGDLLLTDNKAQTKSTLRHVVVSSEFPRIETASVSVQNQFEFECMNNIEAISIGQEDEAPFVIDNLPLPSELDPDSSENDKLNAEALEKLDKKYAEIVQAYNILKTTFNQTPKHSIKHVIDTGDANPIKSKVRPLLANSDKSIKGKKIWEEMERMGVIERVHPSALTQWASPLHLVKKPNSDSWRPAVDYRLLNNVTKADNYPLPSLKNFTKHLKGSKVFSVIDLRSAFFNLPIHEDSVNKTTVLSPWGGAYVFKRLPFGLRNAPSSWMKMLDSCLSGIDGIYTYLDDILVASQTEEEHINILHKLFQRLEDNSMSLALNKCVFAQPTVEYLGYSVSATGIRPLSRKVAAVTAIPEPSTQKELLHFLGALNYFRGSLKGLVRGGKYHNAANLLQPLYSAATTVLPSKKHFQQVWDNGPLLKQAFQDAKQLLINATELAHLDPNLPLALFTDSSDHSIGAVLMQQQGQKYIPLGYFSRHLPLDKANWAVYRKELLAAQAGLRYFIGDIYGKHCTIWTDHLPLVNAYNGSGFQLHDPVAQRALMEISQFTKDIRHISGINNVAGDYFSRLPPPDKQGTAYQSPSTSIASVEGHKLSTIDPKAILEAQQDCKEIEELKTKTHQWGNCRYGFVAFGDVNLFCELTSAQPRPVLPFPLRHFVIKQLHDGLDHSGLKEAKRRVAMYYFWKTLKQDVEEYVRTCHGCQSVTPSKTKPPHIGSFETPDQRFTHVHLDIVGPLPASKGYKYILTIKDRFTRFLQAIPLIRPTSEAIAEAFMLHWTALFGIPSICTSDQGPNLTSDLFKGLQDQLGIKVNYSPIYYPQANGMIERSHQSLKNSIKASLIEMGDKYQQNWVYYLPWALLGIRSAFNRDLGTSSMEMTMGKHAQLPGTILADPDEVSKLEDINVDAMLKKLQLKNNRLAVPPSISKPNPITKPLPDTITHVYARQHNVKGLSGKYTGPWPVVSRPTRSTIGIKVGVNKDGSDRLEIRHLSDIKVGYLRDGAKLAEKPKRGRPPKASINIPTEEPKQAEVAIIHAEPKLTTGPPPFKGFHQQTWSASPKELQLINQSINRQG